MNNFDFSEWMKVEKLSAKEAAYYLKVPVALVSYYCDPEAIVPEDIQILCTYKKVVNENKNPKEGIKLKHVLDFFDEKRQKPLFTKGMSDLLVCLNRIEKTEAWPLLNEQFIELYDTSFTYADIHGVKTIKREIKTDYKGNKFQPQQSFSTEIFPVFFAVDFFAQGDALLDDFLVSPGFYQRKRDFKEAGIRYIVDSDIDRIIEMVEAI